jgi:hypothetical protein
MATGFKVAPVSSRDIPFTTVEAFAPNAERGKLQ